MLGRFFNGNRGLSAIIAIRKIEMRQFFSEAAFAVKRDSTRIDPLMLGIKSAFDSVQEHRYKNAQITLGDFCSPASPCFT
jgi:hypothetical protein